MRSGLLLGALLLLLTPVDAGDVSFWATQRKGANCQNKDVEPAYWQAAAKAGIEYIRLVPDAWPSASRDFLLGNADEFEGLDEDDLGTLRRALDDAEQHGIKVLLTFFSLPGARWVQRNDGVRDYRLWNDSRYHEQSATFWKNVATELKDHPALVGYNILNEPHPEREHRIPGPKASESDKWFASVKGTAGDVNVFNRRVVAAIRSVDKKTPIFLDGPFFASPEGTRFVEPVDAEHIFYAVHFYASWEYVTYRVNKGRYSYPDTMPAAGDTSLPWNREVLRNQLAVVRDWQKQHDIPANRIIVSEFGCDRRVEGARSFLADVIAAINEAGYHWAFYAFRGDGAWGGMDYELGTGKLGWSFWKAVEAGEDPESHKKRAGNPLWAVIQREFRRE